MTIRKFEVERLSIKSSKSFDAVATALEAAVGHPEMTKFIKETEGVLTFAEIENVIHKALGASGFMLFLRLDHGAILRKETGLNTPKIMRFVIGNPLIMKEMAKHIHDAGSYAPVSILVDERPDGVYLSYDTMVSLLTHYGNPDALAVARDLDAKVERLLKSVI